jgi:RNA polymerase sigma-54 factor
MEVDFDITLKQVPKLVMTPEMQQSVKILQLSSMELMEYIQREIEQNPMLEIEDDDYEEAGEIKRTRQDVPADWKEMFKQDKTYYETDTENTIYVDDDNDYSYENIVTKAPSLHEFLMSQLNISGLKGVDKRVGMFIVDSIDDNGYLTISKHEIARLLSVERKKVTEILKLIQGFDPVGVGARSLRECLLIQLKSKGLLDNTTKDIVFEHLKDLAEGRYSHIADRLNLSLKEVQRIGDIIKGLEPKPGRQFSYNSNVRYIMPDVVLRVIDNVYHVMVNENALPRLQVSPYYKQLYQDVQKGDKLYHYLTGKLNSALWVIRAIEYRKHTLLKVVNVIVDQQRAFFERGINYLTPLTLKEVADLTGVHESTVSRAINGKYLQTPRGTFELRYFFTSKLMGDYGREISSHSIKVFITSIIERENREKPLSDRVICDILKERGVNISRRTITKYREEMGIPSSIKRKRY